MPTITRTHAEEIVKKLKRRPENAGNVPFTIEESSGKSHYIYKVRYRGKWIGQFNIRRGSNPNLPHSFVATQLHMSPREGLGFADCLFPLDGYIALLIEKKIVALDE